MALIWTTHTELRRFLRLYRNAKARPDFFTEQEISELRGSVTRMVLELDYSAEQLNELTRAIDYERCSHVSGEGFRCIEMAPPGGFCQQHTFEAVASILHPAESTPRVRSSRSARISREQETARRLDRISKAGSTELSRQELKAIEFQRKAEERRLEDQHKKDEDRARLLAIRRAWRERPVSDDEVATDYPVVEVETIVDTPPIHVLSHQAQRQADMMIAWGYRCLPTTYRSRRYEGFKRREAYR